MATRDLPAWLQQEGDTLHFDIPLFLQEAGIRDTPANRDAAADIAAKVAADYWPGIPVEVREFD